MAGSENSKEIIGDINRRKNKMKRKIIPGFMNKEASITYLQSDMDIWSGEDAYEVRKKHSGLLMFITTDKKELEEFFLEYKEEKKC